MAFPAYRPPLHPQPYRPLYPKRGPFFGEAPRPPLTVAGELADLGRDVVAASHAPIVDAIVAGGGGLVQWAARRVWAWWAGARREDERAAPALGGGMGMDSGMRLGLGMDAGMGQLERFGEEGAEMDYVRAGEELRGAIDQMWRVLKDAEVARRDRERMEHELRHMQRVLWIVEMRARERLRGGAPRRLPVEGPRREWEDGEGAR